MTDEPLGEEFFDDEFEFLPTAHIVLDSTKLDPGLLSLIEGYLYGAIGLLPQLLMPYQILKLCNEWQYGGLLFPIRFLGQLSGDKDPTTNLLTNPSAESMSGTIETPDGPMNVPSGVLNDSAPLIWQTDELVKAGQYSACFYWPAPVIPYPSDLLFPDTFFPA